jgi:hypothetical protein
VNLFMQENDRILADIVDKRNLITENADILSKSKIIAFKEVTIREPLLKIPIHGFYTSVSWLYVTYYESGQATIKFLSERADALGSNTDNFIEHHRNIVHNLRTILQHNINTNNREDIAKQNNCYRWLEDILGREYDPFNHWPSTDEDWNTLLVRLLNDSNKLFDICYQAICSIKTDEFSEDLINLWISRNRMNYSRIDWENILNIVARDLGMEYYRLGDLSNKYLQKWNKQIAMVRDDFDFKYEARRIIELSIINDNNLPLPLTGEDIIKELNIPPGPKVREKLNIAQKIFLEAPCNKLRLLELLRDT